MLRAMLRILAVCVSCGVLVASILAKPDGAGDEQKAEHWAFRPLTKPAIPVTKDTGWVRNPIDAFVLNKLESKGMNFSPEADRRTLIRRVYFDLTGLPPTPDEVRAFAEDASPDAYEKLVDRLLASPRYGERWARHWMDVVHFAETHGNDQDRPRPNAWPYRDYLIRSFNEDKPYARFVEEQIAGDVLYPDDPQAIMALGFIAAGPWDESSLMSIVDDTLDKKTAQNLDRDDMLATTMATFASVTVHCARCHNHKFDPIKQKEYYGLQSAFAGVDRASRPYDADPKIHQKRQTLLKLRRELDRPEFVAALAHDASASAESAAWEKEQTTRLVPWTVLSPKRATSQAGAKASVQTDGSVLFSGTRGETDIYTLVAAAESENVTAVRLEVMADDSLPMHGPGRQENGNLHLSEFKLLAAPADNSEAPKPASLRNPSADFNQDGWTIAHAIDGNSKTAWGIHPQVGKPHTAVFELKEPITRHGATLTFVLEQLHGGHHLIGRPRISVTDAAPPVRLGGPPENIARIIATPGGSRNDAQKSELAAYVMRQRLDRDLEKLPAPQTVFAGANDFVADGNFKPAKGCRPVFVLRRGDVNQPLEPATPGALSLVPELEPKFKLADANDEGARRAALAHWLSDRRNVLTWRSIANRVWHYHFGRGIVDTPNDLGKMGGQPSHPELLDFLAGYLQENGGSLKRLHRLIVTSSTYRQSSRHNAEWAKVDAGNALLWRMNRARLDAESIHDAVLHITGTLDLTMGGPSVKQFIESPGTHVTPKVDYLGFDVDGPEARRRSVYRFLFRTLPDPFMDSMDCPDASQLAPTRTQSVTAIQALSMLNNQFMVRYSEHLGERVAREAGADVHRQIERAYDLAVCRKPTEKELAGLSAYAAKHGMANVCRLILNSNEFMFVE
jgi:hypothetical protein